MKAIVLMFDSLNRHMLPPYAADTFVHAPNFRRLAERTVRFDNFYAGSMPCIPARREMHTGRYNFLHRSWGPLEPFDDSMPQLLGERGVHTHLVSDHPHYWEDGGATYHPRYTTWEFFRGQEGDPWKGVVTPKQQPDGMRASMLRQDEVNRSYMPTEAEHSQTRTVDAGLHFLETNVAADDWLLQIELFDPHEPFFTHQSYKELYREHYAGYHGPRFDWPEYRRVTEDAELVEHARHEYAALVSMCDRSLGRVLDFLDEHDLWNDTMLVVNTDHGFLLGEHGWWAKNVQPWFNELVHLPMFLWDPRAGDAGTSRSALTQTIDLAPTVLRWFGVEPPADMQGEDLARVLAEDTVRRRGALFGVHGGHVNVTDGRYVYMRAPRTPENTPLYDYTLMPTHMRNRFSTAELGDWRPQDPFSFTKELRTIRVPATYYANPWVHGTLLYDLETDPQQLQPIADEKLELRMAGLLVDLMRDADAPAEQYERLGLPVQGRPTSEHLLVRAQAEQAAAAAEPLPPRSTFPTGEPDVSTPVLQLLTDPRTRAVLDAEVPALVRTEVINLPATAGLYDLAVGALIRPTALRALAERLSALNLTSRT